jgi:hypothetical protein
MSALFTSLISVDFGTSGQCCAKSELQKESISHWNEILNPAR